MTRTMVELQTRPPADATPPGPKGRRPVPYRPRLSAGLAYVMQKALKPNAVNKRLGALIERSPATRKLFTTAERAAKEQLFGCRMCGQCALPVTGYSCPMGCPK